LDRRDKGKHRHDSGRDYGARAAIDDTAEYLCAVDE
jgi:hypothetical protein